MSMTLAERNQATYMLGLMDRPGLARGFPELVPALDRLYADRMSKIPWVPPTWLASVRQIQGKYPYDLMIPTPGRDAHGNRGQMCPSFADTDAKVDAWHKIYNDVNAAIVSFAAKYQAEGAKKLASLYAAAAFWDAAYKTQEFVKNLPGDIASNIGNGLMDMFGKFLPASLKSYTRWIFWLLVILIAGSLAMWYRGKIATLIKSVRKGAA